MSNLTVPKPLLSFSSRDPGKGVEELTTSYGWRHSFRPALPAHFFLWWEDLDNIQKSEQFPHLRRKEKKSEETMRKMRDETAQVLLWTQNALMPAYWRALIQKSAQYPERQQSKNSRYLVSILQTDKRHRSLSQSTNMFHNPGERCFSSLLHPFTGKIIPPPAHKKLSISRFSLTT